MEDFARRLNSDWPERVQEILLLSQERRPLQLPANGNGSLRVFTSKSVFLLPIFNLLRIDLMSSPCDTHFFMAVSVSYVL